MERRFKRIRYGYLVLFALFVIVAVGGYWIDRDKPEMFRSTAELKIYFCIGFIGFLCAFFSNKYRFAIYMFSFVLILGGAAVILQPIYVRVNSADTIILIDLIFPAIISFILFKNSLDLIKYARVEFGKKGVLN